MDTVKPGGSQQWIIRTAQLAPMQYSANRGASTNAKRKKSRYMIRTRALPAIYIPRGFPQLIVAVIYVRKGAAMGRMFDGCGRVFLGQPVDNRPQFIMGGRGTGKTIKLIEHASKTDGVIVCPTKRSADYIWHVANEMNCLIRRPITYEELYLYSKGRRNEHYYYDDYGTHITNSLRRMLSDLERDHVTEIMVDESTVENLNHIFDSLKFQDMNGNKLQFRIEIMGQFNQKGEQNNERSKED